MATTTPNIGLVKPTPLDPATADTWAGDLNGNADKIDAALAVATPSASGRMSAADKAKLDGIATAATANDTDANLKNRATHTGTQPVGTITGLGGLATKSKVAVADMSATGSPDNSTFLRGDNTWASIVLNSGTVTSVGLSLPTGFTVTGSPVTASGTLTGAWAAGYQAYTAVEATKLAGIATGADVTATAIGAATTKSTLVDTDAFGALNAEASGALVRVQWTAVKSNLKAYLDPIYEPFGRLSGINNQYEVSYTLTLADAGKVVEMAEVEANTLVVPSNASVAFAVGTRVDIVQVGTGQTTIAAASGVTIRSADSKLAIAKQYAGASLYKRATNEWLLMGALK